MDQGSDIQGDQRVGKGREGSPQEGVAAVEAGGPTFLLAGQNRLGGWEWTEQDLFFQWACSGGPLAGSTSSILHA